MNSEERYEFNQAVEADAVRDRAVAAYINIANAIAKEFHKQGFSIEAKELGIAMDGIMDCIHDDTKDAYSILDSYGWESQMQPVNHKEICEEAVDEANIPAPGSIDDTLQKLEAAQNELNAL